MKHPERIYPEEIAADLDLSRRHVIERVSKRADFPERTKKGKKIWWKRKEYLQWLEK